MFFSELRSYHLIISIYTYIYVCMYVLDVITYFKLAFDSHMNNILKQINQLSLNVDVFTTWITEIAVI